MEINKKDYEIYELLKMYNEDSQIIQKSYENKFEKPFDIFNDNKLGVENIIKLLKGDYEVINNCYTVDNLPSKFKFVTKYNDLIYDASESKNFIMIMWKDEYGNIRGLNYEKNEVINYLNDSTWKIV